MRAGALPGVLCRMAVVCAVGCTTPSPATDAGVADGGDGAVLAAQFTVLVGDALRPAVADWAGATRLARVATVASHAPVTDLAAGTGTGTGASGIRVAVLPDLTGCTECYRLEHPTGGYVVHADGVLGAQYGLTHLLEAHGYRFFHPVDGHAPADPARATVDPGVFNHTYAPEQTERAIQLWTLHPVEAQCLWQPSDAHLAQARAILDWVVRNRGNTVYLPALQDILSDDTAWRPHMRAILDEAHLRGLRVGVGVQLFGGPSSLQHAFTLLANTSDPPDESVMRARYHTLLDGLPFDTVNLQYGEFHGAPPAVFVADTNLARRLLTEISPGTGMTATVHVGCYPGLQVTYMGQSLQYYLLVQFADPSIVPWVHTVMYQTLFDGTGGAYNCTDFGDHRDFLLGRLARHQPVAYNPESAYWVAFDSSVPQYLPVYMYSRWRDLSQIRQQAAMQGADPLTRHVLFSSGWEWGYWQTDAAVLRMGFSMPDHWSQPLEEMFAPWGIAGAVTASQIAALGAAQFDALVTHHLAAYLAGRDALLDAGEQFNHTVSQPGRPSFQAVVAMDAPTRAMFASTVLTPLDALASATDAVLAALPVTAPGVPTDPWLAEVRDGVAVDSARAHFASAVWHAAERYGAVHTDGGYLAMASQSLAVAQSVVARRHANLHWPEPMALLARSQNPTIYPYGYLYFADTLCYWQRELSQVNSAITGAPDTAPGCILIR